MSLWVLFARIFIDQNLPPPPSVRIGRQPIQALGLVASNPNIRKYPDVLRHDDVNGDVSPFSDWLCPAQGLA